MKIYWSFFLILFSLPVLASGTCADVGIVESHLVELDGDGHEVGAGLRKVLTLYQNNRACRPTTFELREEKQNVKNEKTFFRVTAISEEDGCGSRIFSAQELNSLSARTLRVVDHTTRTCEDYKKYTWEVGLQSPAKRNLMTRNLFGNLQPVSAIQSAWE